MMTCDQTQTRLHASYHQPPSSTMYSQWRPRQQLQHKHLFIVTGPAGCGKTTVAKYLANLCDLPYLEGDDYHPQSNVEKMANGIPLADADRWDWLVNLREEAVDQLNNGSPGVVLTCSALKRKYRDVIRIARYDDHEVLVHFIYLRAPASVLMQRVEARKGHYMKTAMIKSQLQCLEEPKREWDVHSIDVSGRPEEVESMAFNVVSEILRNDIDQVSSTTAIL